MRSSEIKENARRALKGKWGIAILASIIASICGADSGSISFNFDSSDIKTLSESFETPALLLGILGTIATAGLVTSIIFFVLGSIVRLGYQKFNLDLIDGKHADIGTLFTYFKHWRNALVSNLLVTISVFLWSLLFIIPGIIAAYKYSMVSFILSENPEMRPREALEKSEEMMKGHKMELFTLYLSFLGWSLLCILTLGIGFIWLTPYMNASVAEFYRNVSGTKSPFDSFSATEAY